MQKSLKLAEEYCLEFANTVNWHASLQPQELLHSYADLVAWTQQHAIITEEMALQLTTQAQSQPNAAADVLQRAIALREAIYRVFVAHMGGNASAASDMAQLNVELAKALAYAQVMPVEHGFAWQWATDTSRLDALLWPIVRSAADLLTSTELLPRVGQCADDRGCGWLFLDTSKNHSRRWCDINDCGNRAKQRRHYARAQREDGR